MAPVFPCPRKGDVIDSLAVSFDGKDISNIDISAATCYQYCAAVQSPEYRSLCQRPIHQTIESVATMFRTQRGNSNNNGPSKPKVRFGGISSRRSSSSNSNNSNSGRRNSVERKDNQQQVTSMSNTRNTTTSLLSKQLPTSSTTTTHHHHHQQQQQRHKAQQRQPLLLPPPPPSSSDNHIETTSTPNTSGFSSMEIEELKQSFDLFDVEGTGKVPITTILNVLRDIQELENSTNIQQRPIYPNLQQLIDILSSTVAEKSTTNDDSTDDNEEEEMTLDFDDYLRLMEMTTINYKLSSTTSSTSDFGDDENINKLVYVFDLFDIDQKGYITLDDLERIAYELGESTMTRDELTDMIDRAAALVTTTSNNSGITNNQEEGEGRVTLEAFIKMMTYDLFPKKQQEDEGYGDEGIVLGENKRRNSKAEF